MIDHGKDEQAKAILTKWHCGGDYTDPLVEFEYAEIRESIRLEKDANRNSSWRSLFQGRGNLKRMRVIIAIAFFSQWSGNGLVSYYLTLVLDGIGIKDEFSQTLFNGILQIYNLGTAYLGALVVDRTGRRFLWLTSAGGMCIAYVCWTICSAVYTNSAQNLDADMNPINPNLTAGHGVLGFIFIYYGFYNIAMSPLLVSYTVEMCVSRVRGSCSLT